ncbi:MAG: DUF1684 domain-containing protein [Acidimicrobiia bacterium]
MNDALNDHRSRKDRFFAEHEQSPIRHEDRAAFSGLAYFDPDDSLRWTVTVDETPPEPVTIATTTGDQRTYQRVATATVELNGVDTILALYSSGHPGYFMPFKDATSGKESYGAGRYLDLEPNSDGTVTIDFNYAYAPFCAYNDMYSCALPPAENWLDVPIRAGERNPAM